MFKALAACLFIAVGTVGCGGDSTNDGPAPPPGSCKTGGSATGSSSPTCNQCGQQSCNAEISNNFGSGWAQQYFGGDGACAAFEGCVCQCLSSGKDPLTCSTTPCIGSLDAACQAASKATNDCLKAHCATECR